MKVKIILVVVVFAVLLLCLGNAINLSILMGNFTGTVSDYASGEILELKSVYGKLNGNGNGTQYFGAALLKAESVKDLDALVAALEEKFEVVEVLEQQGAKIESRHLEHRELKFTAALDQNTAYIAVCFYDSTRNSNPLDIAGH